MKDIAAKIDGIGTEVAANLKSTKETLSGEIKSVKEEMDTLVTESRSQSQKALDKVAEIEQKMGQLAVSQAKISAKSFGEQVAEIMLSKQADIISLKEKGEGKVNFGVKAFDTKAAGTVTTANYSGGTVGLTSWDPSFAQVARRTPFLRQLVTVRPVSNQYVAWAEQAARDGGAGNTAEGAAKTQADFDIVEANKKVEKITAYTKVSKEALDDIAFLQSEIQNDLVSLLNLKLDTDLFGGSGTTPVIKGINTYATTFSVAGSSLALGVDGATEFDVLRAALWQVENAYFTPNYILLNPVDVAKMDMLKDTTGQYIMAGSASQFPVKMFYGVPVIANNAVTAGNFLVGDFSKSNLGIREDITISIGYENDDFTKNLVTILGEIRAVHYIKTNHAAAFVKGVFSTAKAALETA